MKEAPKSVLDKSTLDDPAYLKGMILATVAAVGYIMRSSATGGMEAHAAFFDSWQSQLPTRFKLEDKEMIAGADEVVERLQGTV